MKFVRFLLFSFLALCLMCFTAILLISRIKDRNFVRLPTKTLSRYAEFLAEKFSEANGSERALAKKAASTSETSAPVGSQAPWHGENDAKDVRAVDKELEKLMNDAERQGETKEDEEMLEVEEESQETSTEAGALQYDELSCKPHNQIAFLKTHKTGSSTLTNILNRYADLRELKMALPSRKLYRFGWPGYFHWNNVDLWRLHGEPASVLCNHARYRRQAMDVVMHNDTKYITILRDPVYQFESTFNYMELYRSLKLTNYSNPLEMFLRNPHGYLNNLTRHVKPFPESINLIRNGMFFDLGLSPLRQDNYKEILNAIKTIESEFALVLMMEYFDESLVLLKREFCWDLDDVVYIKQNERKSGNNTSRRVLSPLLKDRIRAWNRADVMLYDHFNKTFWERIEKHGRGFYKDLADLKRKNQEMHNDCVSPQEVTEIAFRLTGKIRGFKLNEGVSSFNKYFCQKLLTNEIDYINYFRQKLHPYSEYQKQLRAAGKAPQLVQGADNVIANRIKAMHPSLIVNERVHPQAFPKKLQAVSQKVEAIPQRVQTIPQRLQAVSQKVEAIPQKVEAIPQRVQGVPQRVQAIPQRLQAVSQKVEAIPQKVEAIPQRVQGVPQRVQAIPQRLQAVSQKVEAIPQKVEAIPQRVQGVPQRVQAIPQRLQAIPRRPSP